VRLALSVPDAEIAAGVFEQAGAQLLSHPKQMPGAIAMRGSKRPMGCRSPSTRPQVLRVASIMTTRALSRLREADGGRACPPWTS
jgi:hypothetical protein